jgi:hypothetical protein
MSLRRLVSVLAFLALLAQASAIPRHNAVMLAGALALADETAALRALGISLPAERGLICRAQRADADTGLPGHRKSKDHSSACPVCLGFASAHGVLPGHGVAVTAPARALIERVALRDEPAANLARYSAYARGPPLPA